MTSPFTAGERVRVYQAGAWFDGEVELHVGRQVVVLLDMPAALDFRISAVAGMAVADQIAAAERDGEPVPQSVRVTVGAIRVRRA